MAKQEATNSVERWLRVLSLQFTVAISKPKMGPWATRVFEQICHRVAVWSWSEQELESLLGPKEDLIDLGLRSLLREMQQPKLQLEELRELEKQFIGPKEAEAMIEQLELESQVASCFIGPLSNLIVVLEARLEAGEDGDPQKTTVLSVAV